MDAVEDIKNRLSVEDVIGEYVELKRAGRNFKGLSPFNSERTPSFMVSPDKQIWHDFSSGQGGNMFSFVMEMEGVDFKGSLEILARKAGIDLSLYQKGDGRLKQRKDQVINAIELATKYFQRSLLTSQKALEYLSKKRSFSQQTVLDFRLGYSPNTGTALCDFLIKRDISPAIIKAAGLSASRYNGLADMFRGRLMIPLCDAQGLPIGFTARLLGDESDKPKYINTPQTLLYDKSRHVFGLHLAKEAIRKENFVVIVEGNLDVISSHQVGIKNVVATAGTAITSYHLKILQRFTPDIRLCFDQDKAGIEAAERAIYLAQDIGIQLSIINTIGSKDPDELIQKDQSLWKNMINKPVYCVDWIIERYKDIYDITTAIGKKQFSDVLLKVISKLHDKVEQDHYLMLFSQIMGISEMAIRNKFDIFLKNEHKQYKKPKNQDLAKSANYNISTIYEDQLLCLLVSYPITRRLLETETQKLVFSAPHRQLIYEYIESNPTESFIDNIPIELQDVNDYVKILLFKAEELYNSFDSNERLRELRDLIFKLSGKNTSNQKKILTKAIRDAESEGDDEKVDKLLQEFNNILKKD